MKNIINNQTFLIEDQNEGAPVTTCMDVYKAKIQSDGSLDKLKLRIVVRGDLQNEELVGDTWSPTASMRNLKYFFGICNQTQSKSSSNRFHWSILASKSKEQSIFEV